MPNGRLLILDDDVAIGKTIRFIADSVGMQSQVTTSPAEFFRMVDTWNPTAIAIDLLMPEMDGVQVLGELARRQCQARIVITSGVGTRVLEAAGRSAAEHGLVIAGVLPKPFAPSMLRELLSTAAGRLDGTMPLNGAAVAQPRRGSLSEAPLDVGVADLEAALAERQLAVEYQPKIKCAGGQLAGFEALARWKHPQRGMICPARFIALAEAAGLIDAVTDQVIDQALHWFSRHCPQPGSRQAGTASAAADAGVQLSVNLSARTLRDVDFVERIMARCDAYGVPTSRITVELTETSAMEDPISSLELLTRLRMKGFHLSIDDFGTGYSSMLQLVRLPFSEIKVDKSFVLGATESPEARAVVKSIIDLGHSLGLKATAEGVEDAATLDLLRTLGCDQAQGYVIARPMPGNVVDEWVQTTFAAA